MYVIAAIIIDIVAIMAAHSAHRACLRADVAASDAKLLAARAMALASLAIARVSFSRALRLKDKKSEAHCFLSDDHTPDDFLDNIVLSSKDSRDLMNVS